MSNSLTLSKTQYETIFSRLTRLEAMVKFLAGKLEDVLETEPPYGSDTWWEWSDKKAMEEIKAGKGISFNNIKELKQYLGV